MLVSAARFRVGEVTERHGIVGVLPAASRESEEEV